MNKISIVIPVFNEENFIGKLLNHLHEKASKETQLEIIVVDGGSTDKTRDIVKEFKTTYNLKRKDTETSSGLPCDTLKLMASVKGRAKQMNFGAKEANGNILYFLHADSFPPPNFDKLIIEQIENGHEAGCFRMKFDYQHWWLRLAGCLTILPWKMCRGGDQSIFITTSLFQDIGGFNENYMVYEDMDIISKIYKRTPFKVIPKWLTTSARCYKKHGIWKTQYYFFRIYLKKWLGASPDELQHYYQRTVLKF